MSNIKGHSLVIRFLRENKILAAGTLLALTFNNLLNVLLPLSIGMFYEIIFHTEGTKGRLLAWLPFHFTEARPFLFFFGILILLKVVLTFLQEYWIDIAGETFASSLRQKTFQRQLRLPMTRFIKKPLGKHLARYSGELLAARQMLTRGILIFVGDLVFIVVTFSALFMIQPRLAAVVLCVFSSGILFILWLGNYLERLSRQKRGSRSSYLDFISSRLQAFYTIKSFNRETPEIQRFGAINQELNEKSLRTFRFESFIQSLYPLIQYSALASVLIAVANDSTLLPPADVFVFVLLLLYMRSVMRRLMQVNLIWWAGITSLEKWAKLLREKVDEGKTDALSEKIKGAIQFKNIRFEFERNRPVLQSLSFKIAPASINWLRGSQGSGKGTVFKLIQKILTPQEGGILLDDYAYDETSAFEIRKNVTIVSPEALLLGATIFEAISYSAKPAKRPEAAAMLEQLHLHFAADAETMLDFPLKEHGQNLSAGERIMLQFARAMLTRKTVLLLDQPFGHLDATSREHIVHLLNHYKKKHTIIITSDSLPETLLVDQTIHL
jgi:ABC-type multidrug transport system fused ATPase/permease subunit